MRLSRKDFLKLTTGAGAALAFAGPGGALSSGLAHLGCSTSGARKWKWLSAGTSCRPCSTAGQA